MDSRLILNRVMQAFSLKTDTDLSNFLGITPQNVYNWRQRNSVDWRVLYTKCVNISMDWLMSGEGSMLKSVEKGSNNVVQSGGNSTNIVGDNNFFEDKSHEINLPETTNQQIVVRSYPKPQKIDIGIPLVDISAAAGFGTLDIAVEEKNVIARYVVPDFKGADIMMPIVGDSMEPLYYRGDVVACKIIRDNKYIQWGKPYIIATQSQGFMLKRLYECDSECLECRSVNPNYPPFRVSKEEITGIAIVVGSIHIESLY